jgi:DNA mismatch endonuclease, patch repair protein
MVGRSGSTKRTPANVKKRSLGKSIPTVVGSEEGKRLHRGDIMSPQKRSALMARIRGKHTGPERAVKEIIASLGLRPRRHVRDLPGCPDFVLHKLRVAIFVDGDFWHGWRFPRWRLKLSEKWEQKIESNRRRDARNFSRLRRSGWRVVRIWEHQVERDLDNVRRKLRSLI